MKVYELMNMLSKMEAGLEVKVNFEVKTSRLAELANEETGNEGYITVGIMPYECDKAHGSLFCVER